MGIRLRVFNRQAQRVVEVPEFTVNSVKIGRKPECDVVLVSQYVSGEHALLRHDRGQFTLEAVGRNPVVVSGRRLAQGQPVPLDPDEEIQIAEFSLFVEIEHEEEEKGDGPDVLLARLEQELHKELLDRAGASATESRLRELLDEMVQVRIPDLKTTTVPLPVLEMALRESFYGELVQSIFVPTANASESARVRGFVGEVDTVLRDVIQRFRDMIEVSGKKENVRKDLNKVAKRFQPTFEHFLKSAHDALKVLFVRRYLIREIMNLVLGYGPLQDLLQLPDVNDIMVVHKSLIYVERGGRIERLHRTFVTEDILLSVIQRIVEPLNRHIDMSSPLVDARLEDGSRVNAVIRPLAVKGSCLTIRKFSRVPLTVEDLVRNGALTRAAIRFLEACVRARKNVIISGGTGSGKTTLLNILSGFIRDDERIVTIEDAAELQLRQVHVVSLETRPPNVEGKGAYTIRDLVRNSLRMRPDRIVVGECRGGEALDMLQAMNTGHDGSLTTIHANTPSDALLRLETLVLQAEGTGEMPVRAIRDQIEAAIQVIVQQRRLPSGKRMVTHVSEVVGIDPDDGRILTNDIFELRGENLCFSGYLPSFMGELIAKGGLSPAELFERTESPEGRG